ncbi:MAG: ABC transporter permease [Pseudomonadota bacterium]
MSSLPLALGLARRELRGGIAGFRVFLACLMLGVAAIAAVGSLAASLRAGLEGDARLLLGGDVDVALTHRPATAVQRAFLAAGGEVSGVVELRAMARTQTRRELVELKAVDDAYPLVGAVRLSPGPGAPLRDLLGRHGGAFGAAAEAATLARLGLAPGERLQVGDQAFVVRAVIENEPDRTANVFTLGPRLMVSMAGLEATGLVQPGSLIHYHYRVKLAGGVDPRAWTRELRERFPDAGWRVRGLAEAAPGVQRWLERIAMFLGLVGLTALLVGGVGVANAVRSHLDSKTATIATLKCLGAPGRLVLQIYMAQIMAMAALGIVAGLAVGAAAPSVIAPLIADQLPVAARIGVYKLPLALAAAFGMLTALAFSLWPLARAAAVPPGALFRDVVAPVRRRPPPVYSAASGLALAAIAGLAVATAPDRQFGLGFVVAAALAFLIFRLAAFAIAWAARRTSQVRHPGLRLALANLNRPGSPAPAIVLSLGLGLSVLIVVVLVHGNLARQLREQLPELAPTFFFIDLQADQVAAFDDLMAALEGVGEVRRVPWLRGRIVKLAGIPVEAARVAPEAQWAIGSDRGLTYAAHPPPGTRLVAGAWWPADYRGPPLLSFDAQLARGMGLGVGDTMTLNVLGREIEARISNLRAIDWTTLGINFTLVLAPGALEAAPQTHIATAAVTPGAEDAVERAVVERFPNVSSIRVREALATVERVLGHIGLAAGATATLTLLAGTLVLAGAVIASHRRRIYDAVVLKVLGARRRDVVGAYLIEFGLLGLATSAIAAAVGTVCAYLLMKIYMQIDLVFLPGAVGATAIAATLAILGLGLAGTWRALGHKPARLLRNP